MYLQTIMLFFFFQAEDGIRDVAVTGVQTCALPIWARPGGPRPMHPTSRGGMVAPGIAPPPVEQQRRPADKRGGRSQRDRIQEQEEKILRPTVRREAPSGPPPINREITISEGITVKELSE